MSDKLGYPEPFGWKHRCPCTSTPQREFSALVITCNEKPNPVCWWFGSDWLTSRCLSISHQIASNSPGFLLNSVGPGGRKMPTLSKNSRGTSICAVLWIRPSAVVSR